MFWSEIIAGFIWVVVLVVLLILSVKRIGF